MKAKNYIFSSSRKTSKKRKTPKSLKPLEELLNTTDIRNLPYEDVEQLKSYVNKRQKQIKHLAQQNPEYETSKTAASYKIHRGYQTPQQLQKELMRQQQFFNNFAEERDYNANKEQYNLSDLDDNDKWRMLRRIATEDIRLSLDRAYASQTLKELEDIIEKSQKNSVIELYDSQGRPRRIMLSDDKDENIEIISNFYLEKYRDLHDKGEEWDTEGVSFSDPLDIAVSQNKGFHGYEKAKAKYRHNMNNYEPSWDKKLIDMSDEEVDRLYPF